MILIEKGILKKELKFILTKDNTGRRHFLKENKFLTQKNFIKLFNRLEF